MGRIFKGSGRIWEHPQEFRRAGKPSAYWNLLDFIGFLDFACFSTGRPSWLARVPEELNPSIFDQKLVGISRKGTKKWTKPPGTHPKHCILLFWSGLNSLARFLQQHWQFLGDFPWFFKVWRLWARWWAPEPGLKDFWDPQPGFEGFWKDF